MSCDCPCALLILIIANHLLADDDKATTAPESLPLKTWRSIKTFFGPVSFITLHYAYFIITCFIASLVFWGSSTPSQSVRYIDSVFLAVSAMTEAVSVFDLHGVPVSNIPSGPQHCQSVHAEHLAADHSLLSYHDGLFDIRLHSSSTYPKDSLRTETRRACRTEA